LAVGFSVQRHAIKFQAVADKAISGLLGDAPLQILDFVVVKFHNLAALNVDQVVVVLSGVSS
jgi:hypothetical protein